MSLGSRVADLTGLRHLAALSHSNRIVNPKQGRCLAIPDHVAEGKATRQYGLFMQLVRISKSFGIYK
jgi:hypothetical protein